MNPEIVSVVSKSLGWLRLTTRILRSCTGKSLAPLSSRASRSTSCRISQDTAISTGISRSSPRSTGGRIRSLRTSVFACAAMSFTRFWSSEAATAGVAEVRKPSASLSKRAVVALSPAVIGGRRLGGRGRRYRRGRLPRGADPELLAIPPARDRRGELDALEPRRIFQQRDQRARRSGLSRQLDTLRVEREIGDPRVARNDLGQLAEHGQGLERARADLLDGPEKLALALELPRHALDGMHLGIDPGDLRVEPGQ